MNKQFGRKSKISGKRFNKYPYCKVHHRGGEGMDNFYFCGNVNSTRIPRPKEPSNPTT
jgi:hypothetical protein